jgi:1-acyl-sn-glycerol-3-phosphate acyltransferase
MGLGPHRTGQERVPAGGALVVSNHSGGISTPDVLIFASAFYDEFGYDRPVYTLAHDRGVHGPAGRQAASHGRNRSQPRKCRRRIAFRL